MMLPCHAAATPYAARFFRVDTPRRCVDMMAAFDIYAAADYDAATMLPTADGALPPALLFMMMPCAVYYADAIDTPRYDAMPQR